MLEASKLLREKTRVLHEKAEQLTLLKQLAEGRITLAEYCRAVELFFGFWLLMEEKLKFYPKPTEASLGLEKLRLDLSHLGYSPKQILQLPVCEDDFKVETAANGLGVLYVALGSQLGRSIIYKNLQSRLDLPENSTSYFKPNDQLWANWRNFQMFLNASIQNVSQMEETLWAAKMTFQSFIRWFHINEKNGPVLTEPFLGTL
ncbi:biliverdin-producing heme oxygenase [Sneathiella glossodoripedis]|uniref:biliverdin-producing heme oxygenase n=1 Tax=Sneathiella glossodoripedis TaxID=418853 RepID=UPI00046FEC7A|nr:biliverdin-producing heme oxygenase [Sneathiella glossodoripedis]